MARTRARSNTIVASVDGSMLFWIDGVFSGDDQELLANVRLAAQTHLSMLLTADGPVVVADDVSAVGAAAALLAARPGRVRLLEVPVIVQALYPEDESEGVVLVVDGVVEGQVADAYTTDEQRELFGILDEGPQDPRVKLVVG
jgi:hypothetical protein